MTNIRTITVLLAGVAMAAAQIPAVGWCPDYLTMQDFDMSRYLGMWYEAERYFTILEAGSRCVSTNYTKAVDGRILVSNEVTNRLTGIKRVLDGEIRTIPRGGEAKLVVKYTTLPYPVESSYGILDTDYKSYAVVWSCSGLGLFNTQNAWVMTRERNPAASVLQKSYGVLDKFKISRSFFVKTDQSDCQIAEPAPNNENSENKVDEDKEKEKAVDGAVVPEVKPVVPVVPAAPAVLVEAEAKPVPTQVAQDTAAEPVKTPVVPEVVVPEKQADVPSKPVEVPVKSADVIGVKQDPERNRKQ